MKDKIKWWDFPVDDWTKINIDSLKLMLAEGQKYFAHVKSVGDKITRRTFAFFTALLPVVYLTSGFLLTQSEFTVLNIGAFILFVPILVSIVLIVKIIWFRKEMYLGSNPRNVFHVDSFIEREDVGVGYDLQYKGFVLNLLENCQHAIDVNDAINKKRGRYLRWLMRILIGTLIVLILFTSVYSLFYV